jgi:hypothetical protein
VAEGFLKHKMKRALLLNIIVSERAPILQLLAGKDETLLIGRAAPLILSYQAGLYLKPSLGATPSLMTENHLVSEPSPYPCITDLGAWMRIIHISSTILPYARSLPCPGAPFGWPLVVEALGSSRSLILLQSYYSTSICVLMNFIKGTTTVYPGSEPLRSWQNAFLDP